MPTIYDNNLVITSRFGFKRSGGAITSVTPAIAETTKHLWELNERPESDIGYATKILRHLPVPVPTFISPPGDTSTQFFIDQGLSNTSTQELLRWYTSATTASITLLNEGNSPLTINTITQNPVSNFGTIAVLHTPTPFTISSASSVPVVVGYYGAFRGNFSGYLLVLSDFAGGPYKINTQQEIKETFSFEVAPTSRTTIADQYGQQVIHSYTITPSFNNVQRPENYINYTATLQNTNAKGWNVIQRNDNTFDVRFRLLDVDNQEGTYTNAVTVVSDGGVNITATVVVSNTVIVDIDPTKSNHVGSWSSSAAPYNSVIVMSYDTIDSEKYLTIGVGVGGNNTPIYAFGGAIFTSTSTLGVLGTSTDFEYAGWSTVYRIPLGDTAKVFYSGSKDADGNLYKVKSTPGIDYEQYFGTEGSEGSMFIVDHDGSGNVKISINYLRELSGDTSLDKTLKNLTRAFYYYSEVDDPPRYYQLSPGPILDQTVTEMFLGFDYKGQVVTSIVPLPISF